MTNQKNKQIGDLRVLVVDDDELQLEYLAELLRTLGVKDIGQAISGQAALFAMKNSLKPYDLLIVDLYMPDMDGFQLMEAVSKRNYKGALVIASGQSDEVLRAASELAKLRSFNFLGAVSKPVEPEMLGAFLAKV
ncbi:MAG: response regulator [Hylemonella sp.]|nr:response regulator [Hylemonella sp.]